MRPEENRTYLRVMSLVSDGWASASTICGKYQEKFQVPITKQKVADILGYLVAEGFIQSRKTSRKWGLLKMYRTAEDST